MQDTANDFVFINCLSKVSNVSDLAEQQSINLYA
jgi:hypothetical protein